MSEYGRTQKHFRVFGLGGDKTKVAQAGVPTPTDDEVIVHRYAERCGGLEDVVGYGNIGSGRGRIARGVIMHEDQRRRSKV